ncbi:MAG: peptidase, partial [Actinocatenispora sp.]
GLNSAYLDGSAVYHTPLDTPAAMDRGSLQEHGDNALALARAFGAADLRDQRAAGDATYFPVLGLLVRYPGQLTWPLAVLAVLLVGAAVALARRRSRLTLPRLAGGFGLVLVPIVLSTALAQAGWALLLRLRPGYAGLMTGDPYHPGWYRLAVTALTLAVLVGWYLVFRRRIGAAALALAGLCWLAVFGVLLAAAAPGGSYLTTLPAVFGGAGALVALRRPRWSGWALTLGALPAVLVLAPTAALLFPALGLATGAVGALLVTLAALVTLPLLELALTGGSTGAGRGSGRRRLAVPAALLVVAVGCGVVGFAVDGFDADHPAPVHLTYALDADSGRAFWASSQPAAGQTGEARRWLARYVGTGTSMVGDRYPMLGNSTDGRMRTGPARAADLSGPRLSTVASHPGPDGYRTLRLRLTSPRGAPIVGLYLPAGTRIRSATVQGRRVVPRRAGPWALSVTFFAAPPEGITVELTLRGTARARILDESDGLTGLPGYRPRPAGVGVAPAHDADETVVARTVTLATG